MLSNVALTVLDEFIAHHPGGPGAGRLEREKRRRRGLPNIRLVRFADDWCLVVHGTKTDATALREEIAGVLSTLGLRLSQEKTLITHIALLTELTAEFRQVVGGASDEVASLPA